MLHSGILMIGCALLVAVGMPVLRGMKAAQGTDTLVQTAGGGLGVFLFSLFAGFVWKTIQRAKGGQGQFPAAVLATAVMLTVLSLTGFGRL